MPEYITTTIEVERRTYLKGRFKGKFIGQWDQDNSDKTHENFYDLEILEGEIHSHRTPDIRTWEEGEFDEFIDVDKFLVRLPDSLPCTITYDDGTVKHFKIKLYEPKLIHQKLLKNLYDGKELYTSIEGKISGYLKHYDTEEIETEIPDPPAEEIKDETYIPVFVIDKTTVTTPSVSITRAGGIKGGVYGGGYPANRLPIGKGWRYGTLDEEVLLRGCLAVIGVIFGLTLLAYVLLFLALVFSPLINTAIIGLPLVNWGAVSAVASLGVIIFLLFILQAKLSSTWKWIIRLIIIGAFLFLCFNRTFGF